MISVRFIVSHIQPDSSAVHTYGIPSHAASVAPGGPLVMSPPWAHHGSPTPLGKPRARRWTSPELRFWSRRGGANGTAVCRETVPTRRPGVLTCTCRVRLGRSRHVQIGRVRGWSRSKASVVSAWHALSEVAGQQLLQVTGAIFEHGIHPTSTPGGRGAMEALPTLEAGAVGNGSKLPTHPIVTI